MDRSIDAELVFLASANVGERSRIKVGPLPCVRRLLMDNRTIFNARPRELGIILIS